MFVPLLRPGGDPGPVVLRISVRGASVVVTTAPPPERGIFLGLLDGTHCWAIDDEEDDSEPDEPFMDLRMLWGRLDEPTWTVAGRAIQLVAWARTHRYCGQCATPTVEAENDRARLCPACGLLSFPRLAPAVITLVERDDGRALLGRNRNFPAEFYSCLAGFVEPGETLEHAVAREVHEEVGLTVGKVEYFGSQPWPFPHSLMVGFTARWLEGEIQVDETEIIDAQWFTPDDLPSIPGPMSIARRLIDDWITRSLDD
ncbi:MAG: NAD(+) diphosphatase [Acidimicrobiales bacterium]